MASGIQFAGFGSSGGFNGLGGFGGGTAYIDPMEKARQENAARQQAQDEATRAEGARRQAEINAQEQARQQQQQSAPASYGGITAATNPNQNIQPTYAENTPSVTLSNVGNTPAGQVTQGAYESERQLTMGNEAAKLAQESADAAKRGQMELAARLQGEAEARRIAAFSSMSSGGGNVPTQIDRPNLTGVNEQAARDAAFARAKEQAGSTALASVNALKDIMAGAGKMGSSLESQGIAGVVGGGAHDLNNFTRDQLMLDLNRAADIGDQQYQGGITQRGQDIAAQNQRISSIAALMNMPGLGAY